MDIVKNSARASDNVALMIIMIMLMGSACDRSREMNNIAVGTGDLLIKNVTLIDPVNENLQYGMDVFIRDGIIQSVKTSSVNSTTEVKDIIDGSDFYAIPGFVNSHTHLWQHVSRSVSPSTQLQQWIPRVYLPANHLTSEEFYELNLIACYDALLHGITTALDWTTNSDEGNVEQVLRAMVESGLGGAVAWPHTSAFLPFETEKREFERVRSFARENRRDLFVAHLPPERISIPLLYDGILLAREAGAPISEHILENVQCQRDWLSRVKTYLDRYGNQLNPEDRKHLEKIASLPVPPSIDAIAAMSQNARTLLALIESQPGKVSEYRAEDLDVLNRLALYTGPSYIPFLNHLGAFENGYVSVHSSLLSPEDIAIYKQKNVIINHNPESNAYLASGIAPITSYLIEGLTVSLGTDGAASNDRIDMLAAMRLMSHLQKVVALNIPMTDELDSWGILRTATISGAKALQQEDRIGSIEAGKEADIVLIPKGSIQMHPVSEQSSCIANLLVNSAESKDIHTVISDGIIRVQNGKLLDEKEEELAERITAIRHTAIDRTDYNKEGRSWVEEITIGDSSEQVVRYRPVYPNYIVDVDIRNNSSMDLPVSVVISDLEKAGGLFYASETRKRFPSDLSNQSGAMSIRKKLPPGESLFLNKRFNEKPAKIILSNDSGIIDSFEIIVPDDPLWAWTYRANVYLETPSAMK